ncbi:MAG: molybdopterin-binding protein, partial [Beijerinckiaceae bacterium]
MTNKSSVSIEEAVRLIDTHVRPVRPRYLPLARAVGRRAVEALFARRQVPSAAIAAQRGFGVWAKDVGDLAETACNFIVPRDAPVMNREASLPEDVNAVLPLETLALRRGQHVAQRAIRPGDGVILAGSVFRTGDEIVGAGKLITLQAAYIAELAGVNQAYVRMPVLDVVFNSAHNPSPNDAFVRIVADEVTRRGGVLGSLQFAGGDTTQLGEALANSSADVVYVIGGTGSGPVDTTISALKGAGRMIFHGVRMDPGGTTSLAEIADRPVLALPGCIPDMPAANAAITRQVSLKCMERAVHAADTMEAR